MTDTALPRGPSPAAADPVRKSIEATEMPVDPREIDAAMIAGLYRRTGPLIVANFGALILLTLALWGKTSTLLLASWAGALGSWTMLRFVLAKVYLSRSRPLRETWHWTIAFAVGSTVAGSLWGSSVAFAGYLDTDSAKLVTAFLMAALSAAAIAGYTNSLLAFAGFIVPALVPYSIRLIYLDGTASLSIAAFTAFWGMLLWIMARHLNDGFRESIALSLRNRNLAERLRGERDRAEAANQAKSRFLGHMSHELRTPLNAIIGYSEMIVHRMLGPLGTEQYGDYAADIHGSGRHLLGLVDGMLDLTNLETGTPDLNVESVDAGAVLRATADSWRETATEQGLTLELSVPEDLPHVQGDRERLEQIANILLSNAVKFTHEGGHIALNAAPTGDGGLRLAVRDTGVGMTPEQTETVQVPFARLRDQDHFSRSDSEAEVHGPTSAHLNLPLAKLVADRMGANFAIDSAPDAGTTVSLTFPSQPAPDDPGD